ncbi:MAG: hypothetical protein MJ105_03115 [Lachnospiraceae bacterium]|nr:hypothetical protein [Lachnospiraceae bacterium]
MAIAPISSLGSYFPGYRVSSVRSNPTSLRPVEKIGEETSKSNPLVVLQKENKTPEVPEKDPKENQTMTVADDYKEEMARMMSGVRFSAESIMTA